MSKTNIEKYPKQSEFLHPREIPFFIFLLFMKRYICFNENNYVARTTKRHVFLF